MAIGAGGRLLWSVGRTTLCLWDAYDGAFLGQIKEAAADAWEAPEDFLFRIDPAKVRCSPDAATCLVF